MDKIKTTNVIIQKKIGTWKYSKDLLENLAKNTGKEYIKNLCENTKCRFYLFKWLEDNNAVINHTLEKGTSISIPKEVSDYKQIISVMGVWAINQSPKSIPFYGSITFDDCVIFQHEHQPGLDKKNSEDIMKKLVEANEIFSKEIIPEYIKNFIGQNEDNTPIDITAEDIVSGDMKIEELIEKYPNLKSTFYNYLLIVEKMKKITGKSIIQATDERNKEIKKIITESKIKMEKLLLSKSLGEWKEVAKTFFNKFCSNNNSDFVGKDKDKNDKDKKDNYRVYKLFTELKKTKDCIEHFKKRFEYYIKKYCYDIISFELSSFHKSIYGVDGEGVSRPIFGAIPKSPKELNKIVNIPDAISGPGICFHDTQGFNVEAKEIKIINWKFSCKLVYDFYDHFGLDLNDIQTYENSGFKEWYLLQHLGTQYETKCKAFVNHIIHEEVLELEVE